MTPARELVFVCGLWSTIACAAEPPTVRELSDPARWEFVGDLTFPVEVLRRALACDLDVLAASRSSVPQLLLRSLTQALKSGYANAGFPHVEVMASVVSERGIVVLQIDEGRRYRRGRVEIRGAKTFPVDRLEAAILKPPPKRDDSDPQAKNRPKLPEWSNDEPPSFAAVACIGWKAAVVDELKRLGYLDANLRVSVRPEDDGTATFVVDLLDEGRRAVLGEIEILGITQNSKKELIEFLGLQMGMPLNSHVEESLEAKLRDCGRFVEYEVEIISPPPFEDSPSQLRLTLHDVPNVPPLSEELSPLQQTAVDVARRYRAIREDFELVLEGPIPDDAKPPWLESIGSARLRLVTSPQHWGVLLEIDFHNKQGQPVFQQVFLGERGRMTWLAPLRGAKLEWDGPPESVYGSAEWRTKAPDAEGHMSHFNFGFGVSSERDRFASVAHRWFRFDISPAALLVDVMKEQSEVELKDGVLSVTRPDFHVEFDVPSGGIRDLRMSTFAHLHCGDGLWTEAVKRWRDDVEQAEQQLIADAPVTSLVRFVVDEFSPHFAVDQADRKLIHRLLNAGVLQPLDRDLQSQASDEWSNRFVIPAQEPAAGGGPLAFVKPFLHMMLPLFEQCFPRETPNWILAREGVFLVTPTKGAPPASPANLTALLSEAEAGPLVYLLGASLYGKLSPAYRVVLAEAGLEHLSAEDFRRDCQALCRNDCIPGRIMRGYAETLREGHEEDLGRLAVFFGSGKEGAAIEQSLRELARRRSDSVHEVLPDLAERLWEPLFKSRVEAALRELARPPQAPNAAPQIPVADDTKTFFSSDLEERAFRAPAKKTEKTGAKPRPRPAR